MAKLKVCFHIMGISNIGGTERVTTQIANLLLEHYSTYEIYILSNYQVGEKLPFVGHPAIHYHSFYQQKKRFKPHWLAYIRKTRAYVKREKIDILISVDSFMYLVDFYACLATKCRNIVWEHFEYYRKGGSVLVPYAKQLTMKHCAYLVVLTKRDQCYFQENHPTSACEIVQIYNPFFASSKKNSYDATSFYIVSCGRLVPEKGFHFIPDMAARLKSKGLSFCWQIIGEGAERQHLQQLIQERKVADCVKLVGAVSCVSDYFEKARFFVLTSTEEGLGLVLLEAKAAHLPLVSFDIDCGPDEIILDKENGYLIPAFDQAQMIEKMAALWQNADLCRALSAKSEQGMQEFTPQVVAEKWHTLLQQCVSKQRSKR